jgi:hypothetical protein
MPQHLRPEQEVSPLLTFDQREYGEPPSS